MRMTIVLETTLLKSQSALRRLLVHFDKAEVLMTKHLFLCLLAVFAVIVCAATVHAQVEQGGITGRVVDEAGGVVPGATVIATQAGTGIVRETVTNGSGEYTVPYLSVGTYDVTATLAGFTGARVTNVNIRVGLTATVELSLKVAISADGDHGQRSRH